jgi:hypothetical protein
MHNYNFQEGQQVGLVWNHWGRRIERIMTVTRVTATIAVVNGLKFNRATGHLFGDKYSKQTIEPATPELIAEIQKQEHSDARKNFLGKFLNGNWQSMGEENLDKVAAALGFGNE